MKRKELDNLKEIIKSGFVTNIGQSASGIIALRLEFPATTEELLELTTTLANKEAKGKVNSKNKSFKLKQQMHEKAVLAVKKREKIKKKGKK